MDCLAALKLYNANGSSLPTALTALKLFNANASSLSRALNAMHMVVQYLLHWLPGLLEFVLHDNSLFMSLTAWHH